jgi:hypothetical protein
MPRRCSRPMTPSEREQALTLSLSLPYDTECEQALTLSLSLPYDTECATL